MISRAKFLKLLQGGDGTTFSRPGLVVGLIFFSASLTPSLLPRHFVVQGVLSGISLAAGYGCGVFFQLIWRFLELRMPGERLDRVVARCLAAVAVALTCYCLFHAAAWQNSIRQLMEMEPVSTAYPLRVIGIALVTAALLIFATRMVRRCWIQLRDRVDRFVPRRISYFLSALGIVALLILATTHVLGRMALQFAEATFLELDELIEDDVAQPTDSLACGSPDSLVAWETIGRRGKHFLVRGPTDAQIAEFWEESARRPIRVYVGVRTAETAEERARLALRELIRVGGFQRSVLIVATPTGTGWLDPGAVDTLDYLHQGDTAIVSVQYSYLPSWITVLVDAHRTIETSNVLFDAVYDHWRKLPQDARPKLYLHGLSLGALGSETNADLFTLFEDPIQGGMWSGPPFSSTVWARVTHDRNPTSPVWQPEFRDGSMIRFMVRENPAEPSGLRWGPMRFVYLQHAGDPMTFFSPDLLYRRPAWLAAPRGPDVSPSLQWFPIVTFLQVGFDLPMSTSVPLGYGHNFDAASYIDAWLEVTAPKQWTPAQTKQLKQRFADAATAE